MEFWDRMSECYLCETEIFLMLLTVITLSDRDEPQKCFHIRFMFQCFVLTA